MNPYFLLGVMVGVTAVLLASDRYTIWERIAIFATFSIGVFIPYMIGPILQLPSPLGVAASIIACSLILFGGRYVIVQVVDFMQRRSENGL